MSFLDNLENNLKSLESQEEASESKKREHERRESERARSLAAAPWAERLKQSPFTDNLLKQATALGHKQRTKVYISWMGPILRLEARGRKLELRPTENGIVAVTLEGNNPPVSQPLSLDGDPAALAGQFLSAAA